MAYWLIGQEIVEEIQVGEARTEYGKQVIENLSKQLDATYKIGFSVPNLRNFRQFYQIYQDRSIHYPPGSESALLDIEGISNEKKRGTGDPFKNGFHFALSWSHYRALMRVSNP